MAMPWDRHPDDDDPRPACEHCGHPMVPDAWPSRVWFCEDCDEHIDPPRSAPARGATDDIASH